MVANLESDIRKLYEVGGRFASASDVIAAANRSNPTAEKAIERLADCLARASAITVQIRDPELLIFS